MSDIYDVVIIGSGFAGSLLAMIAKQIGRSVLLLERNAHPRMMIGESSTPLSNLLLEELAITYRLPDLLPFTKWGTWQQHHPEVGCGLKRGFSFFHHDLENAGNEPSDNEMLVAASPHDQIADTHWYRADFDHWLVSSAQQHGVTYLDEVTLRRYTEADDYVVLSGERNQKDIQFRCRFVIDATGPRGCLHHLLGLHEADMSAMPATKALYSHFSHVGRLDDFTSSQYPDSPPYPIDDAAVHHVFDGGWVWVLRFNNGITSAGVAATESAADRLGLREGAGAWTRLLEKMPTLQRQFAEAVPLHPFTYLPRLAFRSGTMTGKRWAMLPSAAGFVDPLLSSGFPLALLGISRLARILDLHWNQSTFAAELLAYEQSTDGELLATSRLIGALYANMNNFEAFRAISLLYFAAASYSETARRLSKPERANSFLMHTDPKFGPEVEILLRRAAKGVTYSETKEFVSAVKKAIEPFDVAGLCASPRNHWYPVNAEDLRRAAWKVGATTEEIDSMLQSSGFYV